MAACGSRSVMYWEDPAKTAAIFLPPLVILYSLTIWSLLSVVAYTFLGLMSVVLCIKGIDFVMSKLGKPNPLDCPLHQLKQLDMTLTPSGVGEFVTVVVKDINNGTNYIKSAVLMENIAETVKFAVFCYFLRTLGGMFNAMTLVLICWILAFTLPKIYLNNKETADEIYGKVMTQINEVKAKVFPQPKQE